MVYYFLTTDQQRASYRAAVRPLARRYKEYLNFVVVDANEYPEMLPMLGLTSGETPALALQNPSNGQVFPYEGGDDITSFVVERFVLDIVEGLVKPWEGPREVPASATGDGHDEL